LFLLQVDEPYTKVQLRPDIDQTMIDRKKWPHWKARGDKSKEYQSTRALGKLWDLVETKFEEAVGGAVAEPKPDERILGYVANSLEKKLIEDVALKSIKERTKQAIDHYLCEKRETYMKDGNGREAYLEWHDHFCRRARNELIRNESSTDQRCLVAAVLYQQAVASDNLCSSHRRATEFAWGVAVDYLCRITSDASSAEIGSGRLPLAVAQDMAKVLLSRR
jgi:hypothetical protein